MGKWNYRRRWTPKNYYRDQRIPSPPTYYDTEFKFRGAWKNVELPWEERFCISVGIQWEKVVNAKKYMNCYDNVVNWNDSAGEESFSEAKKRFWAKINDIPTDNPQLDPDIYSNHIDWNSEIDLELVKDIDRAYFNPDEAEKGKSFDGFKVNNDGLVPGCILGLDDMNPSNKNGNFNKKYSWGCSNNTLNKNLSDPWERGVHQDDREVKDSGWGGGGGGESSSWQKDITWGSGGGGANTSWQRVGDNSARETGWGSNRNSGGGGANKSWQRVDDISVKETGWGSDRNSYGWERGRGAYAGTSRGIQRGNYRGNFGNGWESNLGCRKRENSQQYTSSYKSARFQSDDYRAGGNRYPR